MEHHEMMEVLDYMVLRAQSHKLVAKQLGATWQDKVNAYQATLDLAFLSEKYYNQDKSEAARAAMHAIFDIKDCLYGVFKY